MSPRLRIIRIPVHRRWLAVFPVMSAFALAGLGAGQALAQREQIHKLTADDAAAGDWFGFSVAISGDIAIVGAVWDDDACPEDPLCQSGSAYLFEVATGQQLHKLAADDDAMGDGFGSSVAISGGIAIVGAYWDDEGSDRSGSAYLFDADTGQQLHKLTADDAAAWDFFGSSVAISEGIAIVGAYHRPHEDDACPGETNCLSGSAYLFDAATGQQLHKLTAADAAQYDAFGYSVSIDGGIAIVGARHDDDAGIASGSAYLFDVTTGKQLHKLTADDAAAGDKFGFSVAISGDVAIIGALKDDDACPGDPECDSGSAYLFDVTTGEQLHKLTADDDGAIDWFGRSVAISGNMAIAGARGDLHAPGSGGYPNGEGSAYVFDVATGLQHHKLTASDAAASDAFGYSIAISGGIAIVGAVYDDDMCPGHPQCNSGSAYLFDASYCPWDFDGDDDVDAADLASLLGGWGLCPPKGECPADLDGDGIVGTDDLAILLANWGPCP